MRILHVEDNQVDADLVARALERAAPEATIEHVPTLHEARRRLDNAQVYDLALIDLQLPDGSGIELLNQIREKTLPTAVVMLTGSGDQQAAVAALQSGADDYVAKEVEAYSRLPATIASACQRFKATARRRSRTLRVLYAEHNAADVDLTRRHMNRFTPYIKLKVVPDALHALRHLPPDNHHPSDFDVVLFDYRLPGIDALDAVKVIRGERRLDIPVVIVSGQGSEEIAAQAIHLGVDDYITKHPGYLYELAPTLEKVHRQAELAHEQLMLRKTSRHFAYLLEASPVVLYTLRLDGEQATANWVSANLTRLYGYTEEEALQPGWWAAHIHRDDRDAAVGRIAALHDKGYLQHDYRFLDKDGRVHWIRDELRLVPQAPGQASEALGAWHNVTDQKHYEQIQQARIAALDGLLTDQSLNDVLQGIAQQLENIRPDMRVSIMLRNERENRLYSVAAPSLPGFFTQAIDGLRARIGRGADEKAAPDRPIMVRDVADDDDWSGHQDLAARANIKACWSVPFQGESGDVLGTFEIFHDRVYEPNDLDLALMTEFARLAGLAVQRANTDANLRQAAAVFASTSEGVVITDLAPRIIAVNRAYTEITGYTESEVIGCNPGILQSGRQDETFYQTMWACLLSEGHWQGEIWNRRKNGEVFPQLLTISTVKDNDGVAKNFVGVMTDISQIKQSEANLERLAHYDPLTGLPNRLLIHSRLEHALIHARRSRSQVAVLFADLDRFKNVNDSLGHPVGDQLLQALAQRFQSRLRGDDTVGRLGGDEFLIILDHSRRPEDAAGVARELIELLEAPFELPDHKEVYIGASIGISIFPQDGEAATLLIQNADTAMYQAKEHGRNTFRFYTPALTEAVNQRLELESRIRRALANEEFVLHYQPQIDIGSGTIVGFEVLARWNDPYLGMISPADFIPIAEDTGLILPLGDWVLDTAGARFKEWLALGNPDLTMAINLSGRQLQQHDIVARIARVIETYDLPPSRLKLELTESMIMGHGEQATTLLNDIKTLGVGLSIDDFGTGHSSLSYLKRFPIDELKIDRSFVRDIPDDPDDAEIAATIIAMARNLRLRVLAEGVETQEQADFLAARGCSTCQGYLYHRPMPAAALEQLLRGSS